MSHRVTSKAAAANWPNAAITVIAKRTSCRWSMDFSAAQVEKLKQRFKLDRVVLISDRGMITDARIREELEPAGLDWITALRAPAINALAGDNAPLQMALFDE